jgi:hypothetical protein
LLTVSTSVTRRSPSLVVQVRLDQSPSTLTRLPLVKPSSATSGAPYSSQTLALKKLLAVLSVRFSDQPQRWAAAPAAFMGLAGLAALSGSTAVHAVFRWVWPPVLLGLVVWMFLLVRRQLPGRGARWLLYPVLAVLLLAALGGGFETVRE